MTLANRECSADPARESLEELVRVRPAGAALWAVSLPAPIGDPSSLLAISPSEPAFVHSSASGPCLAGVGASAIVKAAGPDRATEVRRRVRALFRTIVSHDVHTEPVVYGGLSFADGGATELPWQSFGDATFVLPRWTYRWGAAGARLVLVLGSNERVLTLAEEHARILAALSASGPAGGASTRSPTCVAFAAPSEARWIRYIEGIAREIAAAEVGKVVAADRADLRFDGPVDPSAVYRRLAERFGDTTCFAIRHGRSTFVGATPERLVQLRGRSITTEALAGSIRAGSTEAHGQLLDSAKDRDEHRFVVDEIVQRLAAHCVSVEHHPLEVRELPHVLHLCTPITGVARDGVDVLDLVASLHPTSAVGGVPRDRAMRVIGAHERTPRGWYSGPVGWVDERGDGELSVALRSGLLFDDTAWVYGGAGIVRDSRADSEYVEADLKRRALYEALGVTEPRAEPRLPTGESTHRRELGIRPVEAR